MGVPLIWLLVLQLALPNRALTPGVVRPLTTAQVCATRWSKDARHVTETMKREVATRYGLTRRDITARGRGPCCEVDHVIPRELGGADDVLNLQPQPWREAHRKDVDENRLHRAVCAGTITLAAAQQAMRQWGAIVP
jgi:hypothetical protein